MLFHLILTRNLDLGLIIKFWQSKCGVKACISGNSEVMYKNKFERTFSNLDNPLKFKREE